MNPADVEGFQRQMAAALPFFNALPPEQQQRHFQAAAQMANQLLAVNEDGDGGNLPNMFAQFGNLLRGMPGGGAAPGFGGPPAVALDPTLKGVKVRLENLAAEQYNGRCGVVIELDPTRRPPPGRYKVKLEGLDTSVHIKPANLNRASGLDLLEPLEALKQAATEQSLAAVDSTVRRALALHLEADPLFPAARKNQKVLAEKIEQARRALAECSVNPLLEDDEQGTTQDALLTAIKDAVAARMDENELAPFQERLSISLQLSISSASEDVDTVALETALAAAETALPSLGQSSAAVKELRADVAVGRQRITEIMAAADRKAERISRKLPPTLETPKQFVCPITYTQMSEPVLAADGFSYERSAIERWLQEQGSDPKSPSTGKPLESTALTPNVALKQLIREYDEQIHKQLVEATEDIVVAREKSHSRHIEEMQRLQLINEKLTSQAAPKIPTKSGIDLEPASPELPSDGAQLWATATALVRLQSHVELKKVKSELREAHLRIAELEALLATAKSEAS